MSTTHEVDKKHQDVPRPENRDIDPPPFLKWEYQYNEDTGRYDFKSIAMSDKSAISEQALKGALKRTTGTTDATVGEMIIHKAAYGMTAERNDVRLNNASTLLPVLRPNDETASATSRATS